MATTTDRDKYRPRVQFVCDREVADLLQQWATEENRTRSNLTETLILEAIQHRLSKKASNLSQLPHPKTRVNLSGFQK